MSAIVCGKRSLFEELAAASPPVSKKIRYSSSARFSPPNSPQFSVLLNNLASSFPEIDNQILEQAFHECGDDLDSTITCLTQLRLESASKNADSTANQSPAIQESNFEAAQQASTSEEASSNGEPRAPDVLNLDGAGWAKLFARETRSASDMNDAETRAARAVEVLIKSIRMNAGAEEQEKMRQQESLICKLTRIVVRQHKKLKESEDRSQEEVHQLKQLISQYQEQMRTQEVCSQEQIRALKMKIYDLTIQLKHAEQYRSIPGRNHPDVF